MPPRTDRRTFLSAAASSAASLSLAATRGANAADDAPAAVPLRPVRFGVSTYSFWQFRAEPAPIEDCIDQAARMGFDGVEILQVQMGDDQSNARLQRLKSRAHAHGLALMGFSTHQGFVNPDKNVRDDNVAKTLNSIDIAYRLGIPTMRINTGRWGTSKNFDELMANKGIEPNLPGHTDEEGFGWVIESINGVRIDEKRSLENQLANLNYRVAVELEVRDGAGVASRIKLDPSTRPEADFEWDYQPEVAPEAANEPAAEPAAEPAEGKSQVGTIQIPISDVKNKAFAIVPSNYSQKVPHGLLVLFGDAGSLDQSKWAAAWEPFAREHRWIIAVAQSSDEKGWSFEEVEVGMRMQTWLARTYSIDRRRIAVGGFDSGAILAYITAAQFPELFRGVWLSNPKAPRGLRINPSEPFKAASYFVNSSDKGVDAFVERIRKNGYSVQRQGSDLDSSKLVEAPLLLPVQRWLRLLEAY